LGEQADRSRHRFPLIEFEDPDGHALALAYGFEIDDSSVRYTRDLKVLRLGHVLLTVKDTQRSHDFYTGILGFRLSDWVYIDDNIRLCFLRCNERHHSLAFAPCMPGKTPRLQHAMFEVESLDDVMRSYHFLRVHKAPIGMGPGRHPNCQTVHVYAQTPGGFAVEFGWGHRRLDDATHEPVVYPIGSPVDVWGGDIQSSEFELG
jgi:2,3-dihydroxy-p-cumate/2,3-dihydroxybenzoate 3,4-dioxygenase